MIVAKLLTIVAKADAAALVTCASAKYSIYGVVGLAEINGLCDRSRYDGNDEQGQGHGQQYRERRRRSQHVVGRGLAAPSGGKQLARGRAVGKLGDVVIGASVEANYRRA